MELLPHHCIKAWESFARDHGYRFTPPSGYPNDELAIEARVDGTTIALTTRRHKKAGRETRVRALARHAMLGRVDIRSAHWTDWLVARFRARGETGEADLDADLTTFSSSDALLRALLDPLTIETLRKLRAKHRLALVYENGAITLRWAGVELSPPLLDAAVSLVAFLALTGTEVSPYR